MTENERKEKALLRYRIIEPLVTGQLPEDKSNTQFFKEAAEKTYTDIYGNDVHVSWQCISKWHLNYTRGGFDALMPKTRNDFSTSRKMDEDIISYIRLIRSEYPRLPATMIYSKMIDSGIIRKDEISLSTVTRYVRNMKKKNGELYSVNEMRRYEREHINEVWCGDSSVGPYIKIDGKKQRTYIIALIDDASRMITGIDIFLNDNFVNLMSVIRKAVTMYGKPKVFNFDNGANYRSNQMILLGARMGTALNYCAPYTPTSKAKIERWFRTMKDHWMAGLNMNEYSSLDELGESLRQYVSQYNQTEHSALNGKCPQDRFFEEAHIIKRYSSEEIDRMFLLEIERKVSNDNVVVIDGTEYEVHYKYAGMKLTLRYTPDLKKIYVYDPQTGECEDLVLLDRKSNSKVKRTKVKLSE